MSADDRQPAEPLNRPLVGAPAPNVRPLGYGAPNGPLERGDAPSGQVTPSAEVASPSKAMFSEIVGAESMIGRDRELDAGERFLKSIADGDACLVLDGEAGIGKTTIWCELLGKAQAAETDDGW
jgi:hypothetical protein